MTMDNFSEILIALEKLQKDATAPIQARVEAVHAECSMRKIAMYLAMAELKKEG
jgi:hypothetical protein